MELEEMKGIWNNTEESKKVILFQSSETSQLEYNKKMSTLKTGEIIGLAVAYTFAGGIIYNFNSLDNWYLRLSGCFLVAYLSVMPLYTLFATRQMRRIDLAESNYKKVLEHFYATKGNLKKAEKTSLIASPLLFVASILILTKVLTGKSLFSLNIPLYVLFMMALAFLAAILFNVWVFKKRDKQFKSVNQLLEEED